MADINTEIDSLPKIRPAQTRALKKLGIKTIRDLLFHLPFRYEDYSSVSPISQITPGQQATVIGKILSANSRRSWTKRKMHLTEIVIDDGSGKIQAVWFNQRYLPAMLTVGKEVRLSGKISLGKNGLSISNPAWEFSSRDTTHTGRLVPIYPETEGLTSKWIRWKIAEIFKENFDIEDPVPENLLEKLHLPSLKKSLIFIHFPKSESEYLLAQKRFAFQEMLLLQLGSLQIRSHWKKETAVPIEINQEIIDNFISRLPFQLTGAQKKSVSEISKDLEKSHPMNRLLNGDVGSGKTIVAAIASLQIAKSGNQVAIMAPTEVLALQHLESFCKIFENQNLNIALLTNSYRFAQIKNQKSKIKITNKNLKIENAFQMRREELLNEIKSSNIDIIIGTHALIQKDVRFKNLALVIVDEQHRFGVSQRASLVSQTNADLTRTDTETINILEANINNLLYEDLTYKIRGSVFKVKKELGLGHKEKIYQKALEKEFEKIGLKAEREKNIDINYNEEKIGIYRPDFILEDKVILELKALPFIGKFEKQQVWHYLKGSSYKLAMLINFGREDVGIERFIHTDPHKSVSGPHKSVSRKPHLLSMTATPIPRTLTMAFFGNLDISVLDEMPKNRKPIITKIISNSQKKEAYEFVKKEVGNGRQAFIIFPLVEESEAMSEVKAAVSEHKKLSEDIFPDLKLGLLHGRLKSDEKERVMQDFKDKKYDILVATSVVEVGIDIPNASVIIIENAERFGLSQLHQFRGRVGRGQDQSYCFLFGSRSNERLKIMAKFSDGFSIAEKDLKLRGPGQFLGTRQSGLPDIAMENIANIKLIEISRKSAEDILKTDPELEKHPLLKKELKRMEKMTHLE